MTRTATARQAAAAADLLCCIGRMLADGQLGRVLDAAGGPGARLRADLMLAILDVAAQSTRDRMATACGNWSR